MRVRFHPKGAKNPSRVAEADSYFQYDVEATYCFLGVCSGWSERVNDAYVHGDHSEVKITIQCVLGKVQSEPGAGGAQGGQINEVKGVQREEILFQNFKSTLVQI